MADRWVELVNRRGVVAVGGAGLIGPLVAKHVPHAAPDGAGTNAARDSTLADTGGAAKAANLSDLTNAAAARANIGADLAANVNFTPAGTGALVRTVQSKARDSVSVNDFGAVGHGVTDDATAFQLAIDYIKSAGGGTLLLVPGCNYFLNQQINLCDDLCIWGYGAKITVGTAFAGVNKPLFKNFSGAEFSSPGTVVATRNLSFFGFEVDGASVGIPGSLIRNANMAGAIICLGGWAAGTGADNVVVRDCNMHDFAGAGVMLWNCTNVDVSYNKFTNFFANASLSVGSAIDFHHVVGGTVTGNKIGHTSTGLSWHGMVLLDWDGPSENLVVSDNIITNMNGGDGISCEGNRGPGSNGRNVLISNNLILDCEGQGIGVDHCISVKCTGNVIRRVVGPGILATGTLAWEATGNTVADSALGGIVCRSGANSAIVTDNDISNITYFSSDFRGHGIEVVDDPNTEGRSYLIAGNRIKDVDGCGIFAHSLTTKITGNIVYNAGRSTSNRDTLRMGIRSRRGASVTDNDITSTGATQYGVGSGSGDLFSFAGNRFSGAFIRGWYHIGYRGTGINHDLAVNIIDAVYDAGANVMSGRFNGVPAGYFYKGDTMLETQPAAGGFIGRVVTSTPSRWKTFGAISP